MAPKPCPQAESVLTGLTSISTCNPTIVVQLKDLLLSGDDAPAQSSKATTARQPPTGGARKTTKPAPGKAGVGKGLSDREKLTLATQVINQSLKLLGDASKPPPPPTPSKRPPTEAEPPTSVPRRQLRRSTSMPLSPLQPRSLNRTSTSPLVTTKAKKPAQSIASSTGCLATVECVRIAFAALRGLQDGGSTSLPERQVEDGMSSFIARLIGLGMLEQASKELRILKSRLQPKSAPVAPVAKSSRAAPKAAVAEQRPQEQSFPELLDFSHIGDSRPLLALAVTTQLQVLKVLVALKKPAFTAAALPLLKCSHGSSPLNLLLRIAEGVSSNHAKVARQMETFSQLLLSLVPNVSSKDDGVAMEPRINVSPITAFELTSTALEARLSWWKMAGHKGNAEESVFVPLAKALSAYRRRSRAEESSYDVCHKAFQRISQIAETSGYSTKPSARSSVAMIYQILVIASKEAGLLKESVSWATKLFELIDKKTDSTAKYLSVLAQLLALHLKHPAKYIEDDALLTELTEGLQQDLKGATTELEDMLQHVNGMRRAAVALLGKQNSPTTSDDLNLRTSTRHLLESFICQCIRFCVRWLGKPPASESNTKDFLRYEQRRQFLSKLIPHILESALGILKALIDDKRAEWAHMDAVLAESLTLLDYMGEIKSSSTGPSFHVLISHIYFMYHNYIRQQPEASPNVDSLKALHRSIDCIKHRSNLERNQGKLMMKLERMAEACKATGRTVDALGAFQSIRTTLVDDGVLSTISQALDRSPPLFSWTSDAKTNMLSRTLSSIAALEQVPMNWTVDHTEAERAAVLEHQLHIIMLGGNKPELVVPSNACVKALLQIYYPTRYPLRRLRTLLAVFSTNVEDSDIRSSIQSQIEAILGLAANRDLGEDAALDGYLEHYRTMYDSILAFTQDTPDLDALGTYLSTWGTLLDSTSSKEQLLSRVDDPAGFSTRLGSIADVARSMGQDQIVTMALELQARVARMMTEQGAGEQLVRESDLASQYVINGDCFKAEATLKQIFTSLQAGSVTSAESVLNFHLSYTEYYIAIANFEKAESHLSLARDAGAKQEQVMQMTKHRWQLLIARASLLQSMVDLEKGNAQNAMAHAKNSVKALLQAWNRMERQAITRREERRLVANASEVDSGDISSFMNTSHTSTHQEGMVSTARIWNLFLPLFQGLSRLSAIYAHHGMFKKTVYYAEQAQELAQNMGSALYMASAEAWLSSVCLKADQVVKASDLITLAKSRIPANDQSFRSVYLDCELGRICGEMDDLEGEQEMLERAETKLKALSLQRSHVVEDVSENIANQMSKLTIKERPQPTRKPRTQGTRKQPAGATRKKKEEVATEPKAAVQNPVFTTLEAALIVQKVEALLNNSDWTTARALLSEIRAGSLDASVLLPELIVRASCLLGESMQAMSSDAVFAVIQDSTLSYPSVCASISDRGDRRSLTTSPALVKGKGTVALAPRTASGQGVTRSFVHDLMEAQECLVEAQTLAAMTGDGSLLHRVSAMLQSVVLFLSAASSATPRTVGHPGHATSSAEMARNLTWRRERKVLPLETSSGQIEWPLTSTNLSDSRRTSHGISVDMGKFQHDYIDIIPKEWNVISIYLSDNKEDLCVTKMQAGQSPFVIRLPLERASSRDVDSEVFNFHQGRSEMLDIIKLANASSHTARNMSDMGNYAQWWAEREALDARLQSLLANIEHVWLGGFRGIFAPHQRKSDMVAKFHKSFQAILDKHLPSRRQVRGKRGKTTKASSSSTPSPKIALDPRILELFIGLGDANEPECDMDDALNDLLYFVVDILQFHGERNAYDEIDFDSMVVETFDALRSCHAATVKQAAESDLLNLHTILILDKPLHAFPWESLPCMQGRAVSRVPSLACLRRLLLERDGPSAPAGTTSSPTAADPPSFSPTGHRVSPSSGTYILNPSADLTATQATFEGPFRAHLGAPQSNWSRIIARTPTEKEFETALAERDILLYFGHGSGAQYIRDRTVRTLEKCRATAFLMGCGSASLTYNGQFEVHGPAWNYMLAGCPAVVGTLWDVTDKDIDRFACRAFEEWGLFPRGTLTKAAEEKKRRAGEKARGNRGGATMEGTKTPRKPGGGRTAAAEDSTGPTSLVQAVAAAREAPRFRYLTAASVVVYGIPVYIWAIEPHEWMAIVGIWSEEQANELHKQEEKQAQTGVLSQKGRYGWGCLITGGLFRAWVDHVIFKESKY